MLLKKFPPLIGQTYATHMVGKQHGNHDPHDQQYVDQRGTPRGQDVALNEFGGVARILDFGADQGGQNGGREYPYAVGAQILQEPRDRSEDRPAPICSRERPRPWAARKPLFMAATVRL